MVGLCGDGSNSEAVSTADSMSKTEFDSMMSKGLEQARAGEGLDLNEAFKKINESI